MATRRSYREIMRRRGFQMLIASLLCVLFIGWWLLANRLPPPYSDNSVGPGRFPALIALLGAIFSLWMLACAATDTGYRVEVRFPALHATMSFVVLLPTYALLMQWAGFYAASIVALPLILLVGGCRRVSLLVGVPLLFCLFVYGCFGIALHVPIP